MWRVTENKCYEVKQHRDQSHTRAKREARNVDNIKWLESPYWDVAKKGGDDWCKFQRRDFQQGVILITQYKTHLEQNTAVAICVQQRWTHTRRRQRRAPGMMNTLGCLGGHYQVSRATEEKDLGFPREQKASWDKGSEVWSCFLTRRAQTSHWDGFEVGLEGATQTAQ